MCVFYRDQDFITIQSEKQYILLLISSKIAILFIKLITNQPKMSICQFMVMTMIPDSENARMPDLNYIFENCQTSTFGLPVQQFY